MKKIIDIIKKIDDMIENEIEDEYTISILRYLREWEMEKREYYSCANIDIIKKIDDMIENEIEDEYTISVLKYLREWEMEKRKYYSKINNM
jgi:nicotinic acid mononucleotide adenylyltransferase